MTEDKKHNYGGKTGNNSNGKTALSANTLQNYTLP